MYNKTLKVKDLIDDLSKCDPDKDVFIDNSYDGVEDPYYRVGFVISKNCKN